MRARLVFAVVLFAGSPAVAADKPEPKYESKPLAYWVQRLQKAETDKDRDGAAEALKAFGPDAAPALPTFIEMLADHSPSYRARVIRIIAAIGPKAEPACPVIVKLITDNKDVPYDDTLAAIVAISSGPKEAVPVLIPLLEVATADWYAYRALCGLGPRAKEAIPAIRRYVMKELAAMEKEKGRHFWGADQLTKLGADAVPLLAEMLDAHGGCACDDALGCLEELGPKAGEGKAALLKLLKRNDPVTQLRAALLLWKIEKHPAVVSTIAELVKADPVFTYDPAKDKKATSGDSVAVYAADFLGEIGPGARAALPQLREVAALGRTFWLFTRGGDSPYASRGGPGFLYSNNDPYWHWRSVEERIRVGGFAARAIDKIEGEPKR